MKKVFATLLSLALAVAALAACGGQTSSVPASQAVVEDDFKIGVLQYAPHPALDAAYEGFVDALAEEGFVVGDNLSIDQQNAAGEAANCPTIAAKLVNDQNDLILAIATPAAQAVANATEDIPVLFTAVTDPVDAGLAETAERPGFNVTGTSDMAPTLVAQQMGLLKQLVPDAQTVGILYSSSEANSLVQAEMAHAAAEELGLEAVDYTISTTGDLQQVLNSMIGKVDAIYTPTDNTIANNMTQVADTAIENGIPVIVGEEGMVDSGGLASYSISYYELGRITGQMAAQILRDGALPAEMPVRYQEEFVLSFNEETAKALNIEIPAELLA